MNLWIIFITGMTIGGLTCLAVQGGLLGSIISSQEPKDRSSKNALFPTIAFLVSKLIAYTILGFLLGLFGKAAGISQNVQIFMQFIVGIYMVAVALDLLKVHPIFRYAIIQPPKFILRKIRNQSKSTHLSQASWIKKELFAPILLGVMTIFIPCGTTLAMEALAISSASPLMGALIMFVFILGTTPLFFGVGFLTGFLGENFRGKFLKIAAVLLIYLGITSINGALVAINFPINSEKVKLLFQKSGNEKTKNYSSQESSSSHQIHVYSNGYSPSKIQVKKDSEVTITLVGNNAYSCASAFRIPEFGISHNLGPNEKYTFSFTPKKQGNIIFTCSMGMYSGVIEVL